MSDVPNQAPEPPPFDEARERTIAWWLVLAVLATLTVVKPLSGMGIVGTIAVTVAALMQLYLPMRRADKLGLELSFIGLHLQKWREDLKIVGILIAITFPPYILGHHLYMTAFHDWANSLGWESLASFLPDGRSLGWPEVPEDLRVGSLGFSIIIPGWMVGTWTFITLVATHGLGVALPEETFYRGYLQPRLESRWPPARRIFGVPLGRAAVIACALFALGHFLGEWNPLRLGPFFPALIFAWQRNATGSIFGAITYHAACNVFGEVLFRFYQPG